MLRRINLSAAFIVLVCFFLPWLQVGCGNASEMVTGLSVAREKDALLWLVPLLMMAVLIVGLLRARREQPGFAGIIGVVCGIATVLVLIHDRMKADENKGLLPVEFTGFYWLAFISAFVVVATSVGLLARRRPPG